MNDSSSIKQMFQLSPEIQKAKTICIFGTGINARYVFLLLAENNIYADFFADKSPQCENVKVLLNRPVLSENELMKMECVVIIASTAWKEISKRLHEKKIYNIFVAPTMSDRRKQVIADENYLLSVGDTVFDLGTVYVCCPCGLGDTLYIAALAKEYKKSHPEIKRLCLIIKENHKGIASLFSGVDEMIISNQMVEILYKYSYEKRIWKKHNYIYGHFTIDWLHKYDLGLEKGNMVSFYKKYVMHMPDECALERPQFQTVSQNFEKIDRNVIILMPYAQSSEMLPGFFWERMGKRLKRLGYEVYTNTKDESEKVVAGTQRISETVEAMAQLCERSFAVISLRSGMCDLLALTNTTLLIINTEEVHLKLWNVKFVTDRENIFNFDFCVEHDINSLGAEILKIIKSL